MTCYSISNGSAGLVCGSSLSITITHKLHCDFVFGITLEDPTYKPQRGTMMEPTGRILPPVSNSCCMGGSTQRTLNRKL